MVARDGVVVAGVGMTRFGRAMDRTVGDLADEAAHAALRDAEIDASDIDLVFFSNAAGGIFEGQEMIRGEVALRRSSLDGVPIVNVENACASGASAVALASMAVRSGAADVAMALGAEKLVHPDRSVSFAAINTAVDVADEGPVPSDRSLYMERYAEQARAFMDRTGATVEDFAEVSSKNHRHGAHNPLAQFGGELSVSEVLAGRQVVDPLTVPMCAPLSDGAAAVIVSRPERLPSVDQRVTVRSVAISRGSDRSRRASATEVAAREAYASAGVGPDDLDVVELHDAAAPAELLLYEQLGLCAPGEASALLRSGTTTLGGRLPVNPSGGLLSKGHPIGASGCAQIVELTDQLRQRSSGRQVEGARIGLAHNAGGWLGDDAAVAVVTILATT